MKEKVINKLDLFGYNYSVSGETIKIHLEYSLLILIQFSSNKVSITDRLKSWNFLTGTIAMSIKQAMLFNFIGMLIGMILFIFINQGIIHYDLLAVFIFVVFWILVWTIYYIVKSELLKKEIREWAS
jgi:hypothetical protein